MITLASLLLSVVLVMCLVNRILEDDPLGALGSVIILYVLMNLLIYLYK